ncbi:MAG: TIGR01212 family radical SAM protein [Oscillospiraceae bacterium]|nr:TIGR01212 family radical SAM protein [Oscillospiraceae bacterium]
MFYRTFNQEMVKRFGCKVYKIALDGGFTCPNRDGTLDTRGCIFCSGRGSGDFAFGGEEIEKQLEYAMALVSEKNKGGKFVAYFQNFTSTYAPTDKLRELYEKAMAHPKVVALSVGTRPDCLPDDVIELLKELNQIKPVWVELGLQTIHEKTAEYIRRGYTLDVYDDAVRRLKTAGLEVITHMIIGLPGETRSDIVETARYIGEHGADGIKLQLLHVLKGTDLALDYEAGKFTLPTLEEYIDILIECIRAIPESMVLHRITGDGAKRDLIAPMWSADKKRVLNTINRTFDILDVQQGSNLKNV